MPQMIDVSTWGRDGRKVIVALMQPSDFLSYSTRLCNRSLHVTSPTTHPDISAGFRLVALCLFLRQSLPLSRDSDAALLPQMAIPSTMSFASSWKSEPCSLIRYLTCSFIEA